MDGIYYKTDFYYLCTYESYASVNEIDTRELRWCKRCFS